MESDIFRGKSALVIGCGIAGSCLSRILELKGCEVYVADGDFKGSSSISSAGIINPVTGKKYVLSWNYPELIKIAIPFYTDWSVDLQLERPLLNPVVLFRSLTTPLQLNDWNSRRMQPEYDGYMDDPKDISQVFSTIKTDSLFGPTKRVYQLNILTLIESWKKYMLQMGRFFQLGIDYNHIHSLKTSHNKAFDFYFFCEGHRVCDNPYFSWLPIYPNLGQALLVNISHFPMSSIFKKNIFIAPYKPDENIFWVGSTYERTAQLSNQSEMMAKEYLLKELADLIGEKFKLVNHLYGVRPTVPDRRPIIGRHPLHQNIYIVNGLGTKGASLAPYVCLQLIHHIAMGAKIDSQIDISRFLSRFSTQ